MYMKPADVLSNDYISHAAPSILATDKAARCSDGYTFIPTIDVVEGMRKEGWYPVHVQEVRTRDENRMGHQKHMIRFRHQDMLRITPTPNMVVPETILVNGHDGSAQYRLYGGLYRYICANGMVISEADIGELKVRHSGDVVGRVIEGTYEIVREIPKVLEKVRGMQAISLLPEERVAFAEAAMELRWPQGGKNNPGLTPQQILFSRRREDFSTDLWTTFQRVQENLTKGGQSAIVLSANGRFRRKTARPINGIDQSISLNRDLWELAERTRMSLREEA